MPAYLTRTEEEKIRLASEVIDYLNDLIRLDPDAVNALVKIRVDCNQAISDHATTQVGGTVGSPAVGVLGLLNGLVGVRADSWGYITAVFDDQSRLLQFQLTAEPTPVAAP